MTTSIRGDHRYVIVVEHDKRETANSFAAAWDPNPDGDETFGSVRLSADGEDPPTHTACNTLATDDMRTQVLDAMSQVPFVSIYESGDNEDPHDLFLRALADLGLQRIEPEELVSW